ncbi:MAG: cytochrome b/b6 domain-containing protein [Alteraurantiacibacter sp.]
MQRYSKVAITFHWLIALLLAGQIALGFTMSSDASGFADVQLHKSVGIVILVLSLLRLFWRISHKRPAPLEGGVFGFLSKAVHVLFYVFMIGTPLTGWALVSSSSTDIPTMLFGVVSLPHLPLGTGVNGAAHEAHELLAFMGIGLFVLHTAGALRHHFIVKDGLLSRMSPAGGGFALAMLLAVLLVGGGVFVAKGGLSKSERHDHATDHDTSAEAGSVGNSGSQSAGDGHDHVHGDGAGNGAGNSAGNIGTADGQTDQAGADEGDQEVSDNVALSQGAQAEGERAPTAEPAGPPANWAIQPGGSLRFRVDNGGTALNGRFAKWTGDIAMNPDNPQTARIAITVDLASATLGDATQDTMLRREDFLNTSAYLQATWRSTSVRRVSGNRYQADGTLSLKGASRPQSLVFTLNGTGNRRSVSGNATIDRKAFSVGTGSNADNLAGSVNLSFTFDATS